MRLKSQIILVLLTLVLMLLLSPEIFPFFMIVCLLLLPLAKWRAGLAAKLGESLIRYVLTVLVFAVLASVAVAVWARFEEVNITMMIFFGTLFLLASILVEWVIAGA